MSQYNLKVKYKGKDVNCTYGYDRLFQSYFVEIWDGEDEYNPSCIKGMVSNPWMIMHENIVQAVNSEIAEFMQELGLPSKHIDAVIMDIPF